MKIFLAGSGHDNMWLDENFTNFYRLESYYNISNQERKRVTEYKDFILDSGAFTYLNGADGNINWDKYVENYAAFINKYSVKTILFGDQVLFKWLFRH